MDVYFGIVIIHVLVGFLLVYFAAKAYKKTKYMPMLYLTLGFFLIVIGDTGLLPVWKSSREKSFSDDLRPDSREQPENKYQSGAYGV